MLPRKNRLSTRLFKIVQKKGRVISRNPLIRVLESRDKSFKAGITVSKKLLKNAVTRNKLRRRIYSALRLSANKPQAWIIIQPNATWLDQEFTSLQKEIELKLNNLC